MGSLFSVLLSLLSCIAAVDAHALLVRSTPEAGAELAIAPPTVELWFSEPLEAGFSTAYLVDGTGNEIGRGAAMVDTDDPFHMTLPLDSLSPGFYTVVWETLSQADGHRWVGSFPLTLLNPDGSRPPGAGVAPPAPVDGWLGEMPTPSAVISRWLALFGSMLLFGALFLRTQIGGVNEIALTSAPEPNDFMAVVQGAIIGVLLAGGGAVIMGGWLLWLTQALQQNEAGALIALLFGTRSGNLALVRQMLVGVALLGCVVAYLPKVQSGATRLLLAFALLYAVGGWAGVAWLTSQRSELFLTLCGGVGLAGIFAAMFLWLQAGTSPIWPSLLQALNWLLLLIGALILASFSLGSHAAAVTGSGWAMGGDWLHLVAAAIWLGGLVLLALILWRLRRLQSTSSAVALRSLTARFSAIATLAVFALMVTGIFSSFVQLRSFSQLWTTTYGWMLLSKLGLVGVTLGIALLNHRFVHGAAAHSWTPGEERPFARRVWTEALISLLLMVVVAILVQTPVPLSPVGPAVATNTVFQEILTADDLSIHVLITPNQPGNNFYQAHLYHEDGSAIGEVQLVRLFFVFQEADLGQASLDLVEQGGDFFVAEGAYQNHSGVWNLSVYVRRRGLDDVLAETTVTIAEPAITVVGGPWENPVPTWPPDAPVTGLLLAIGVAVLIWRWVTRKLPAP